MFLIKNFTVFGWLCICSNIAFLDAISLWPFMGAVAVLISTPRAHQWYTIDLGEIIFSSCRSPAEVLKVMSGSVCVGGVHVVVCFGFLLVFF